MKQVNKNFDTVKVFRGIKTQLSEKLSNMNNAEVTGYLATYNETYYNQSIAETRLKYKDVIDKMSFSEFASFLKNK
jgi:sulfur relay (sulfurtransferase) DsrF/TusC family protein